MSCALRWRGFLCLAKETLPAGFSVLATWVLLINVIWWITAEGKFRFGVDFGSGGGGRQPFFLKNPACWDEGMEFGDVGCVRISFAINSNPCQPILIENQSNPIGIDPKSEFSLRLLSAK